MIGRYWNTLVLVRWSLTIITLVCLRDYPTFQIIVLLGLTMITQIFLVHGRPFIEPLDNKISLFNELMISLYLYVLISLLGFAQNQKLRNLCGLIQVSIIFLSILINTLKFFYTVYVELKFKKEINSCGAFKKLKRIISECCRRIFLHKTQKM